MPVACGARLRCSATRACSRAQLRERVVDFVSALALAVAALALAAVAVASASHSPLPSSLRPRPWPRVRRRLPPPLSPSAVLLLRRWLTGSLAASASASSFGCAPAAAVAHRLTRASLLLPLGSHSPPPSSLRPRPWPRLRHLACGARLRCSATRACRWLTGSLARLCRCPRARTRLRRLRRRALALAAVALALASATGSCFHYFGGCFHFARGASATNGISSRSRS